MVSGSPEYVIMVNRLDQLREYLWLYTAWMFLATYRFKKVKHLKNNQSSEDQNSSNVMLWNKTSEEKAHL